MKKIIISICLLMMISLTGCSTKAKSGEEVQSIIDQMGWTIQEKNDYEVYIIIRKIDVYYEKIDISLHKTYHNVDYRSEIDRKIYDILNIYDIESGDVYEIGYTDAGCQYNFGKKNANYYDETKKCDLDNSNKLRTIRKEQDDLLEEAGLTIDDLHAWGKWYLQDKDE